MGSAPRTDGVERPRHDRFTEADPGYEAAMAAHAAAVADGRGTYQDPRTGYHVLTAVELAAKGYCCGNGCRHCPWPEGT